MRTTILNGEPDSRSSFDGYVRALVAYLKASDHLVTLLNLRDLDLKGCSGCWSCWVKTPGECAKRDESARVCQAALDADLLLFASPMVMGFTTALLKRAADQMIPLVHPYLAMDDGEVHHRARYAQYPRFGLLLSPGQDSDAEDVEITTLMWTRAARNLKFQVVFTATTDRSAEEVAHELTAAD